MARATDARGASAGPEDASLRRKDLADSGNLNSGTPGEGPDVNTPSNSPNGGVRTASQDVGREQPEQHGDRVTEAVGYSGAGREEHSPCAGRRSSIIWSINRSPSPPPRVPSYPLGAIAGSLKPEEKPIVGTSEFLQTQRLAPSQPIQQRQSFREKESEGAHSTGLLSRGVPGMMTLTDATEECGEVLAEDPPNASHAVAADSTIPSVLITSPSLGRISVLCAPDTCCSTQIKHTAETCSIESRPIQAEEKRASALRPEAPVLDDGRVGLQTNFPSFPVQPRLLSSTTSRRSVLCANYTAGEREQEAGEHAAGGDKASELGKQYLREDAHPAVPKQDTRGTLASPLEDLLPTIPELTAKRHPSQEITTPAVQWGQSAAAGRTSGDWSGRNPPQVENAFPFRAGLSRSSSSMMAVPASHDERKRLLSSLKSTGGSLLAKAHGGAATGRGTGTAHKDEAQSWDTRRRYSFPAEGNLSSVLSHKERVAPSLGSDAQAVENQHDTFSWTSDHTRKNRGGGGKPGLDKRSRRNSADVVRNCQREEEVWFLAQASASRSVTREGQASMPVEEESTTLPAAASSRIGLPPEPASPNPCSAAEDALTASRTIADSAGEDRKGLACLCGERSGAAGKGPSAAPIFPQLAAGREQVPTLLQRPSLGPAFKAAAHGAAAATRFRAAATSSEEQKTAIGAGGIPTFGREVSGGMLQPRSAVVPSANVVETSSLGLKQALPVAVETQLERHSTERSTGNFLLEHPAAASRLRTTSGTSVASTSDHSGATRVSAESQQLELLLLRTRQQRFVGEAAAVAACMAAACVKRAALFPVQRLIANTLEHWHRSLESVPGEPYGALGKRKLDSVDARRSTTSQPMSETAASSHRVQEHKEPYPLSCAPFLSKCEPGIGTRRTSHGIKCVSVPLSDLVRGGLPQVDGPTTPTRHSAVRNSTSQVVAGQRAERLYEQDGQMKNRVRCVRVTLFALKQVLRRRHLRQRVALFTRETSPYYFWPPWGGYRSFVEAGGSAYTAGLERRDSDGVCPTSVRQIYSEQNTAEARSAGFTRIRPECGTGEENGGEPNLLETATPTSKGKKYVAGNQQCASLQERREDTQNAANEGGSLETTSYIAAFDFMPVTPTKNKPDLDAQTQRDTTATPSSPPVLAESGGCPSPMSAFAQPKQFCSVGGCPGFDGDPLRERESGCNSRSLRTESCSRVVPPVALSLSLPSRPSQPESQGSCLDSFVVPCAFGAASAPGDDSEARTGTDGVRVSRREHNSGAPNPDADGAVAKAKDGDYCVVLQNYKGKHAVVPFFPNVLAATLTTRPTAHGSAWPQEHLRLPFEKVGTVYVLHNGMSDRSNAPTRKKKVETRTSSPSPGCPFNISLAHSQETGVSSSVSEGCIIEESYENRNGSSPLRNTALSFALSGEKDEIWKQSSKASTDIKTFHPSGEILAVWARTAACPTSEDKSKERDIQQRSSTTIDRADAEQAAERRFWLSADGLAAALQDEAKDGTLAGDFIGHEEEGDQFVAELQAVGSQPIPFAPGDKSEPENGTFPDGDLCGRPYQESCRHALRPGHHEKAKKIIEAMLVWCGATGKSDEGRNTAHGDTPEDGAGSLQEVSLDSFASAYNDMAEEALKQVLTQIRARKQHRLPLVADQLLEERARIFVRRRKEEARSVQHQLRAKFQQLLQIFNKLVSAEFRPSIQNSGSERPSADEEPSPGNVNLEQQFQQRLQDLHQRVEYHLHQRRQLATLLVRHKARAGRQRRYLYAATRQLLGRRPTPRRRLQWYSVGIRWLRTKAALEYFVVRHRQRGVGQLQDELANLPGRPPRQQNCHPMNLNERGEQSLLMGQSSVTVSPPPHHNMSSATDSNCPAEDRPPDGSNRRLPGGQRRGSRSSSGEEAKSSKRSSGLRGANVTSCADGQACGNARDIAGRDERDRGVHSVPTARPAGLVGLSPVTVSEASTPVTPNSPPLSGNEDGTRGVYPKMPCGQQRRGVNTGSHSHTSSVLLLHELLQPLRLDAGGIRAALILVVLRLKRFIRVIPLKEQLNDEEARRSATGTIMTSNRNMKRAQQAYRQVEAETTKNLTSADDGKPAVQDCTLTWTKAVPNGRDGGSLRAQLAELAKLQSDIMEMSNSSAKRSRRVGAPSDIAFATDNSPSGGTSQCIAHPTHAFPLHPECPRTSSGLSSQGEATPPRDTELCLGQDEPDEAEERPQVDSSDVLSVARQFPWSSIRMALVLPNLGVQLEQLLSPTRSVNGHQPGPRWMMGVEDRLFPRDTAGFACPVKYSRRPLYEGDTLVRRMAETFAAYSQTSQQVDSGTQSPAPRRSGAAGVGGGGDAADARAARAAARAAAAETRICRMREREEAETRASGLSDHVVYSGEGSVCTGKAERSRGRSSPERSMRRAEGEGASEGDGDAEEEDIPGAPKTTTQSGLPSRRTGKFGERDNRNGHTGVNRPSTPQVPARVTRTCGILSGARTEYTAQRKQHWLESDGELCVPEAVECAMGTEAYSNAGEGEDSQVQRIEGGVLEPFWWRACCATFRQRTHSAGDDWKRRDQTYKTPCSSQVTADNLQQSMQTGIDRDAASRLQLKETPVTNDKGSRSFVQGYSGPLGPSSAPEAAQNASRGGIATINRNAEHSHCEIRTFGDYARPAAPLQQVLHMVPPYPPLSPSSSEASSSDEGSSSGRRTNTPSDSSSESRDSSTCSDVSVEPSTLLQQLSARQVAAGTTLLFKEGEPLHTVQELRSIRRRGPPQSSVTKIDEAQVRKEESKLPVERTEQCTNIQRLVDTPAHPLVPKHEPKGESISARLPSFPADADVLHSEECTPKNSLEEAEHLHAGDTPQQSLEAAGGPTAPSDDFLLEQIVSALTPHIIVMPSEELVSTDLQKVLPQLQVRFTTCAVELTPKEEVRVLQRNVKEEPMSLLRPGRAVRKLCTILDPIFRTLQRHNFVEEGRGESLRGKPFPNLDGAAASLTDGPDMDGLELPGFSRTTINLIYAALWSAAAELARDVNPQALHDVGPIKDQSPRDDGAHVSHVVNAISRARGGNHEIQQNFPRQVTPWKSRWPCLRERPSVSKQSTMQTYDKLRAVMEDATLYLSGILDVETSRVEASKESPEGDALLNMLQFSDDKANASAAVKTLANGDDAVNRHVRNARLDKEHRSNDGIQRTFGEKAHRGDEETWDMKKRAKTEVVTQSPSTAASYSERHRIKSPSLLDQWCEREAEDFSESLFDFGPKKSLVGDATPKTMLCSPRAFGRRKIVHRLPRLPGLRRTLHGNTWTTFEASEKNEGGTEATWEGRFSTERGFPFGFLGPTDETGTAGKSELRFLHDFAVEACILCADARCRSGTPLFLRPDGWATADDDSGSTSSAEKTSAYAPVSSGSESVYLSVPSSPRRRRQQRQMKWRSRHLAAGTPGAYHRTSAELGGEFSAEGLDKSILGSRKRAHAGRAPRHVDGGSVFRIYPNSPSSTGDTVTLQRSSSSQPPSPPLTRGAAATALPVSQIYTDAEALPAGQRDEITKPEYTTRERRRTAQQDRQFTRYLPEKLSKRQFPAASSSQAGRKSGIGGLQRNMVVSVIAAPSLEWSGPECSLPTPTKKNTTTDATGAPQPSTKGHIFAGGVGHRIAPSERSTLALPAAGFPRTAASAAARGVSSLDSPRETPRPGRRTPTQGSPVPTGVYFDASRRLWRCQWRENGRFKTKGFSLNTYGTLKDARRACILHRCLMGGWEVDPRWLADNDSPDCGDYGVSESHAPKDDDVNQNRASGSRAELEYGEGETNHCGGTVPAHCDAAHASESPIPAITHSYGPIDETRQAMVAASCGSAPTGSAESDDVGRIPIAEPVASPVPPH